VWQLKKVSAHSRGHHNWEKAVNLNNLDLMQIIHLAGRVICAIGLLIFFFNVNLGVQMLAHPGIEVAAAGWLMKSL